MDEDKDLSPKISILTPLEKSEDGSICLTSKVQFPNICIEAVNDYRLNFCMMYTRKVLMFA